MDLHGNFIYLSPSCRRITGYAAGEFMDNPGLFEAIVHPDDSTVVTKHLLDLKSGKDIEVDLLMFRIIDRAEKVRWIELICQPVYGEGGKPLGRRASQREITTRKKAEEALRSPTPPTCNSPDWACYVDETYPKKIIFRSKCRVLFAITFENCYR